MRKGRTVELAELLWDTRPLFPEKTLLPPDSQACTRASVSGRQRGENKAAEGKMLCSVHHLEIALHFKVEARRAKRSDVADDVEEAEAAKGSSPEARGGGGHE